ncbi:MAG: NAD(P)-dependent alcohol dehydrogenase [Blastocatellia bacterium]|nr:NAD(P)-dependent alcohol dehydrogenase [Blastocatellia bacterium]
MRAFQINEFGIDKLALVEVADPEPQPNEVVVRFDAWSLNYRDVMVVEGRYNPRMKIPATPLSDGAGEIVAVGEGVTKWKVGDRVMPIMVQRWFDGEPNAETSRTAIGAGAVWDGILREKAAFAENSVVAVPDQLSQSVAATLPCAAVTAWNALVVSGKLKAGDTVLTQGTGGVSIFAVQFAKTLGARVIATSSSDAKLKKLSELGADETINYRTREDWDRAVLELTEKRGVDHVIEVGGAGTLAKSINAVRVGGHIAMIGALDTEGTFNHVPIFMKAIRLQGIFVGSKAMFEDMNASIAGKNVRPVIDRIFRFEEIRDALHYMKSGAHFGKIVVNLDR